MHKWLRVYPCSYTVLTTESNTDCIESGNGFHGVGLLPQIANWLPFTLTESLTFQFVIYEAVLHLMILQNILDLTFYPGQLNKCSKKSQGFDKAEINPSILFFVSVLLFFFFFKLEAFHLVLKLQVGKLFLLWSLILQVFMALPMKTECSWLLWGFAVWIW